MENLSPRELSSGRCIGRYRIEQRLGAGGMSVVYLARHIQLGSLHAIKVLQSGATDGYHRLLSEGQAQSRLSHPHLVPVTDIIEADGVLALVMAFVRGPTLQELLAEHPLTLFQADHLARGILKGVAAAHRAGFVHRDLKPGNVLLEITDGEVLPRVADFGLVKTVGEAFPAPPGTLLGTPAYMSPEQILDADTVDVRSDVFALGGVLYELLHGVRAFDAPDRASLWAAVKEARHRPFREGIPERMVSSITAALERRREDRPKDADALLSLWQRGTRAPFADALHPASLALTDRVSALTRTEPADPMSVGVPVPKPTSLAATFAPGATRPPVHLPAERDDFVGREADLAMLAQHLAQGERLLTVLGFGGTGKTRLVVHHGWKHQQDWPGGVYFCDLTEVVRADGIVSAMARALDVALGKGDLVLQLGYALAGRGRCLVLLDNFEQVVPYAEETLGRWLDCAVEALFVVTSREVLSLPGERVLSLDPMPGADAAELFLVRALAADRTFDPSIEERASIERLVELLDGLPLAIELAAARIRTIGPLDQLARVGDRFRLLAGKGRATRHATLRATLDWSWELLSDSERAGFCQLSVFEGGFVLGAAEAVLDVGEDWPVDIVQSLMDKSLLRRTADDRFGLLVSVKEYASEQLTRRGGREVAEARHGRHYARAGSKPALESLDRHGGVQKRRALARERDNLVIACQRALARGDGAVAACTALAAWAVLDLGGPFALGIALLEAAAEHAPEHEARLLWKAGKAREHSGRMDPALAHYERALRIARETGDRHTEGHVLLLLSRAGLQSGCGRTEGVRVLYEEALCIHRETGDRRAEGVVMHSLGIQHYEQGEMDEAYALYQQALSIHREVGDRRSEGIALGNLGLFRRQQGRMSEALEYYEQALSIHRETGDQRAEGLLIGNIGNIHQMQGRAAEARTHLERALRIHRETGDRRSEGSALSNLAGLCTTVGQPDEARDLYEQALRAHRETGNRLSEGIVLGNLGVLHTNQGRLKEAYPLYGHALQIHRETKNRRFEGLVLAHLASAHHRQGRMDEARALYEQALGIMREVGQRWYEGIVLTKLGTLHVEQDRIEEARLHLEQALCVVREVGHTLEEGTALWGLGLLSHHQAHLPEALALYEQALRIYRTLGRQEYEGVVQGDLGRLHADQGRFEEAWRYFDTGEALLRSADARFELGRLLAERARAEHRAGEVERARLHLDEASQLAQQLEVGPDSALGRAIARATV